MSALTDLIADIKAAFTREINETDQPSAINNLSADLANAINPFVANSTINNITKDVNNLTYYYTKIQSDNRFKQKKYQIPSDGITNNDTGEITGTITFTLPNNFDYNSANWAQDGGMLGQYTLDSEAKTITFTQVPLANTCFIYYYPL